MSFLTIRKGRNIAIVLFVCDFILSSFLFSISLGFVKVDGSESPLIGMASRAWESLHAPFAFVMHVLLWPNPIVVHEWNPSNLEMFAFRFGALLFLWLTVLLGLVLVNKFFVHLRKIYNLP